MQLTRLITKADRVMFGRRCPTGGRHRWYATGCHTDVSSSPRHLYVTFVNYLCPDCRTTKIEKIPGKFTLRMLTGYDQFNPKTVPDKVDEREIKRAKKDLERWSKGS